MIEQTNFVRSYVFLLDHMIEDQAYKWPWCGPFVINTLNPHEVKEMADKRFCICSRHIPHKPQNHSSRQWGQTLKFWVHLSTRKGPSHACNQEKVRAAFQWFANQGPQQDEARVGNQRGNGASWQWYTCPKRSCFKCVQELVGTDTYTYERQRLNNKLKTKCNKCKNWFARGTKLSLFVKIVKNSCSCNMICSRYLFWQKTLIRLLLSEK